MGLSAAQTRPCALTTMLLSTNPRNWLPKNWYSNKSNKTIQIWNFSNSKLGRNIQTQFRQLPRQMHLFDHGTLLIHCTGTVARPTWSLVAQGSHPSCLRSRASVTVTAASKAANNLHKCKIMQNVVVFKLHRPLYLAFNLKVHKNPYYIMYAYMHCINWTYLE